MQDAMQTQKKTQESGARTRDFPTKEEVQRELKRPSSSEATPAESQETVLNWKEALAAAQMESCGQPEATSRTLTDTFG